MLSHPGLLLIRRPYDVKAKRFATSIPVDEVRRLRSFLAHRAAGDGWRVVIVDEANELNVNAANALLKSLEEPPTRTVFLLVSSAPGRPRADHPLAHPRAPPAAARQPRICAPPRCRRSLPPEPRYRPMPSGRRWSASPKAAPDVCSACSAPAASSSMPSVEKLLSLLPKVDWRAVHTLSDELQPIAAQPRFELFFELLQNALSRLIRAAATGRGERRGPRAGRPSDGGGPACLVCRPVGKNSPRKGRHAGAQPRSQELHSGDRGASGVGRTGSKARLRDARAPAPFRTTAPRPNVRRECRPRAGTPSLAQQHP